MIQFTIKDFNETYPDDNACLDEIFRSRFGEGKIVCPKCSKESNFYRIAGRKVYGCQFCGYQLSPTAGTIFHKSPTSLKNWFYVVYKFSTSSKNGVSAKEVERELGVTYKCAWRMCKQVRILFEESGDILSGIVEADETYVGGKAEGKRGRGARKKTAVFGMVERQGMVKAKVVKDTKKKTVEPLIRQNVQLESTVVTDEYRSYGGLSNGYNHETVKHSAKEYVRGNAHVNSLEGFWSQVKRSINGTYHCVSPSYLQSYLNEFSWRYNRRSSSVPLFQLLLQEAVKPV